MKIRVISICILVFVLTACSTATTTAVPTQMEIPADTQIPTETQEPEPTDTSTPLPTEIPPPTETLEPTILPTNTPEGMLFRDDFNGVIAQGWTWQDEDPSRWNITEDGWLQITGEDAGLLAEGHQSNFLWRVLPGGDVEVTVHLMAAPIVNFQQATIYFYEDEDNYVAINRGFCDVCETGGDGIYMEYKINGNWGAYSVATDDTDLYLRLLIEDKIISGYYALEYGQWERLGRFGDYFNFTRVGIGVTNLDGDGINADVVGSFDYIEIRRP